MSRPADILLLQGDTPPSSPTSGKISFYAKTNGIFYSLNSLGVETPFGGGGTGTVTSVSVTSSNGLVSSVANATSAPAITLSLGNITPTSVLASGTVGGSNLSGTNTGDQTITLIGDITGVGTGNITTSLNATGVTPGTYTNATLAINVHGRITSATNGVAGGSVTSISGSGGTTGLTLAGGPITTSGTLTLGGTLSIANGGTGATTATAATNALLPSQTGQSGKFLKSDGLNTSWQTGDGTGTVTSVSVTTANGVSGVVSTPTTTPAILLTLGAITPTSVAATGTVTGSNLSGTNTGNQTITLTGDVTGSGTGSFAATLSNTGVTANTYGSATQVPVFTVDAKGRISNVTNTTISGGGGSSAPEIVVFHYSSGGSGNFTPGDAIFSQTTGVTTTITDGANCIANYAFTGKSNPPKSIITYGQNFTTNIFNMKDTSGFPTASLVGGGTSASPDIANGIFSSANIVGLQTRMSDTGASSTIGNRAWLVIVFGF